MSTDGKHVTRGEQAMSLAVGFVLSFLAVLAMNRYVFHHGWASSLTDALALATIYTICSIVAVVMNRRRRAGGREGR